MPTSNRMLRFRSISLAASACLAGALLLTTASSSLAGTPYLFRTPIPGDPAQATCIPGSITENTPNASLRLNVAAQGCTTITVTLQGAAGGNGGSGGVGGAGGRIQFTLPATYAGIWTGVIGQGGMGAGSSIYSGANGGGYTSVNFNGTILGVAGGGGGAGDGASGGSGGLNGEAGGNSPYCATGGQGGTDSAGGVAGGYCGGYNMNSPGSPAGYLTGGSADYTNGALGIGSGGLGEVSPNGDNGFDGTNGNGGAGGGGGGYYGGGGGDDGGDYETGGGGGGGSDYTLPSAGNVTDTPGGGGQPSPTTGGTGANGSITISWQ